jgi:hypothetical protein
MEVLCFMKANSQPPLCGIHNVVLVERELPIDPHATHLGHITGYICPVSGQLVRE